MTDLGREPATIRTATRDDVPALVPVLARAFATDPFVGWLVRDDARRADGFARFFELALRELTLPCGDVFTDDERRGAALWVAPGAWHMGLGRELVLARHWAAICGWRRLLRVQSATRPIVAAHPRMPHRYLLILGVDPAAQGRGLGRALLAPMLARCDRDGEAAYLETSTERNVALYQSLGFRVIGEHQIDRGPRSWFMWRGP